VHSLESARCKKVASAHHPAQYVPGLDVGLVIRGVSLDDAAPPGHRPVGRGGQDPKQLFEVRAMLFVVAEGNARISKERRFDSVSSLGSSHNRPTSVADNEEALLLGCPPVGPFWGRASL